MGITEMRDAAVLSFVPGHGFSLKLSPSVEIKKVESLLSFRLRTIFGHAV